MSNEIRMAPHSLEAEEAVIGSVLIDPETLYRVPFLSANDFFLVKHQWIWSALLALNERRAPVDFVTVCEELNRRGQLTDVGGQAYISHLINTVPTAIHAEGYGCIVQETSIRRKLLQAASDIAQLAYEEAEDVNVVVDKAEQICFAVRPQRHGNVTILPKLIADYYSQLEYRYEHNGEVLGLPTGFIDLDGLVGGLKRSDVIIVAARPGAGKTSLLLNISLNAIQFKQHVLIFSLEMSSEQLAERLLSQASGIDSQQLQTAHLLDEDWPRFIEASSHLSSNGQGMWIDDTPGITPLQLRSVARRLHAEHGLDLIVIDYLQLMGIDIAQGRRYENRNAEITYQSKAIKNMARELNVPILVASQMSRAIEQRADKRPLLSDLRESGSIEQDADVVMFIHREDLYDEHSEKKNIAEIIVAKHRRGKTGSVELFFRSHLTQFVNAARREVQL